MGVCWKGSGMRKRLTKAFFKKQGSKGGRAAWENMTFEERSAEMKRRARVRARRRKRGLV
jgi:hypothetical protein